jgi:hypothetical protein
MLILYRQILLVIVALALAGCQTMANSQITELKRPTGHSRIVLMPLDVELSELTAGGLKEPKADWTTQAKQYLTQALQAEKAARALSFVEFDEDKIASDRREEINQFSKLHGAVGVTILLNQYGVKLPTKQGKFDWTLGDSVRALRTEYDGDYAMFVFVRDSYASAGRAAVMVAGALIGIGIPGGTQVGFVSLVDLETGNIVWFNRLVRGSGDMRTADAARETAKTLLAGLPK